MVPCDKNKLLSSRATKINYYRPDQNKLLLSHTDQNKLLWSRATKINYYRCDQNKLLLLRAIKKNIIASCDQINYYRPVH